MSNVDPKLTITGIQKLQRANSKMIRALKPENELGEAIRYGLTAALRVARIFTHVDTGALKASHMMQYGITTAGPTGTIYIDRSTRNPKTNASPYIYGAYLHGRGGEYAFYERVVTERGDAIGKRMLKILETGFPYSKGD